MDGTSTGAARRFGMITAVLTAGAGATALAFGVTTPPRSGPNCTSGCLAYPYDAAAYVPGDFVWMVPALVMVVAFPLLLIALREVVPAARRMAGTVALAGALAAAGLLVAAYAMQLAVVAPSLLAGEARDVVLISMYNPHGVCMALEDAGYLLVGLALLAAAAAMPPGGRIAASIRAVFALAGVATTAALVGLVVLLGAKLDYQFEVASIGITWLALILGGSCLAVWFRGQGAAATTADDSATALLSARSVGRDERLERRPPHEV